MAEKDAMSDTTNNFPTPEEVTSILAEPEYDLSDFTAEEKAVASKVIPIVAAKAFEAARVRAEANKAKEISEYVDNLSIQNTEMIQRELEKIKEANKPPSIEDLNTLLSQEYLEMTVRLSVRGENGRQERVFTIRELPQAVETKLLKSVFDLLVPELRKISALEFTPGTTVEQKLGQIVGMLPGAMHLMADLCAMCLDPYGDEKVDGEWVRSNMSSARIRDVLEAQVAVGRIRDFFSQASRIIPQFLTQ
jgi:hypothetical protein